MQRLQYKISSFDSREEYKTITLQREEKKLEITFAPNLDLYFSLRSYGNNPTFLIGKDNFLIYKIFDQLYNEVINAKFYKPLTEEEVDQIIEEASIEQEDYHKKLREEISRREESNQELKRGNAYTHLVVDNKIIWRSDEYNTKISPYFVLEKKDNCFLLTFGFPKIDLKFPEVDLELYNIVKYHGDIFIRLRNSGSFYHPFNIIFMRSYQALKKIANELDQIHIEEYLIEQDQRRILKK